jgi:hypothetical protein
MHDKLAADIHAVLCRIFETLRYIGHMLLLIALAVVITAFAHA